MKQKLKVAITHGDINSISYEVILKALEDNRICELCTPIIYGSAKIAATYAKMLGMPQPKINQISDPGQAREGIVNIINVIGEDTRLDIGESTQVAGSAALTALEHAVTDIKAGKVDVLVTAPINKNNIHSQDFDFRGHTEYLEACFRDNEAEDKALMILCAGQLRVALVTTHLPVSEISSVITQEAVLKKIEALNESLVRDFAVHSPRIAVLALNPHSGDNGLIGTEEQTAIIPAIEEAYKERIQVFGPYSADGFFGAGSYKAFDGVLAMFHDQGLAPFKTLAMDAGVNFTAGLPIVRTSPDHGTGYDIAGKGEASPVSMREAIYAAIDIARNRTREDRATRHPLRRQYYDKSPDNVVLDLTKDE